MFQQDLCIFNYRCIFYFLNLEGQPESIVEDIESMVRTYVEKVVRLLCLFSVIITLWWVVKPCMKQWFVGTQVMVLVLSVFVYLYNHIIDPVMIMLWCSPSPVSITSAQRIWLILLLTCNVDSGNIYFVCILLLALIMDVVTPNMNLCCAYIFCSLIALF